MITVDDASKNLKYLFTTDVEAARAKAYMERLDDQKKTVKALAFINSTGSAAEREQKALASKEYSDHLKRLNGARLVFYELREVRGTAATAIDMWRSVNSNQKNGNI